MKTDLNTMKKIKITLSSKEESFLKKIKKQKGRTLRETNRVNILLLCNKGKAEKDIADFLDVDPATIWRIKKKYVKEGIKASLAENPRPGQPKKYNQKHETDLTAIACSEAPEDREKWTIELLTEKMQSDVKGCEDISRETVRLMLKKTDINPG